MHKEGFLFVSSRDFLWPGFMLVSLALSGQWEGVRGRGGAAEDRGQRSEARPPATGDRLPEER